MDQDSATCLLEVHTRSRDVGRTSRELKELKSKSASVEVADHKKDSRSVGINIENSLPVTEVKHGRSTLQTPAKSKLLQTVEILSSDHSSDDGLRPSIKSTKKVALKHNSKIQNSTTRGISAHTGRRSPSTSPESSHFLNYSYEEDTNSLGSKNPAFETTYPKLRLPENVGDVPDDGNDRKRGDNITAHAYGESSRKLHRKNSKEDTSGEEGDESNEEDGERNPEATETDVDELPVLPKVPVKRKLMNDSRGSERRTQRGRTKSSSPQLKKQRTPQIDASVITKLEFGRRPQNSVSIPTSSM